MNPSRLLHYLHFRVHPYSPSLRRASLTSFRNRGSSDDNADNDDLSLAMDSYLRFRPAYSQNETLLSGTPERERAHSSSSSSLRKRSYYKAPGVRLREMRLRRVFTSDSCSRRARGVYKVPSNLQRKLFDRGVNHNRGAVRTNPRLARVRATSAVR